MGHRCRRAILGAGLLGGTLLVAMLFAGSAAWAADGPTPPRTGDPVGTDVSPHGGFSATTNFCLQCHEIHNAGSEYALLWKSSVTATCQTCHGLFGGSPSGTRDPAGSGTTGTASVRT